MTKEEINFKLDQLAKKRDHACDVLNKPMLGLTYQIEIDKLAGKLEEQEKSNVPS